MKKALDYLFIGLYRLFLKTNEEDIAEFSALTFLTIGLTIYLIMILGFLGFDPQKYVSARTYGLVLGLAVGSTIYFRHLRGDRYKILYNELLNKTTQKQIICSIVSVGFVVSGIACLIIYKLVTI
ncbi:MAG: hypothetical protein JST46_04370 [Bacteroidetes bacterium]|nr:hypothetical protein [Bacteroidota bacterium]